MILKLISPMKAFYKPLVSMMFVILPLSTIFGQIKPEDQSGENRIEPRRVKYYNSSEINFGFGIGDSNGHSSLGLHVVNGILINPDFSFGIGLGIDRLYLAKNLHEVTPSISLDIRYFFLKEPISLCIACDGGYLFNLTGYNLGYRTKAYGIDLHGVYLNPSIGSKFLVFKNRSINLSIGLKIQETTINYVSMILPKYEKLINFKVGFSF
jgi:hypothetical protein